MKRSHKINEPGLSPKEVKRQRFVQGMVEGKSMRAAALAAGYSEAMANQASRDLMPACRDAFREALQHRISINKLSNTIAAGLDAESIQYFADKGMVLDERKTTDYRERREYAKLAANLMQFEPPKEVTGADGGPLEMVLITEHIGRTK